MIGTPLKIFIVGGYGTFGGRLARLLADEPRLHLIVAGRSLKRATAFVQTLAEGARKTPLAFDRDGDVVASLHQHRPDILIDASGPFQAYGAQCYRLIEACLSLGISYMDLADSRDFVGGVTRFHNAAQAKGIFLLSGASTCPALTAAVVRDLSCDLVQVDSITGGIAPSPHVDVGLNVIRAIALYGGRPAKVREAGRDIVAYPFTQTRRMTISPAGALPLRDRRFSLVDVPDLGALVELRPEVSSVFFGAAPVPDLLHRALNALAWLVRLRLLPSLLPFARIFHLAMRHLRWGEHRGGMFVALRGKQADGTSIERSWHLIAEGDDGPAIPAIPAAAIVRRCLESRPPASGAHSALYALDLRDFDPFFGKFAMVTGRRDTTCADTAEPLFQRLLGPAWNRLPPGLRAAHDVHGRKTFRGIADVERGNGILARCVAAVMHLPGAGTSIPVEVVFDRRERSEIWRRRFGEGVFQSHLSGGMGRSAHLLCERFGPVAVFLALVVDAERLHFVVRGWSFLGIPLPASLAPAGETYETAEDDALQFSVDITHRWLGRIVRYEGSLTHAREDAAVAST